MKSRAVFLFVLLGLLVVAGGSAASSGALPWSPEKEGEPALPGSQEPAGGPLRVSGSVQVEAIHIASELGGRVDTLPWKVGDNVARGDLLVRLDATALLGKLAEAEAAVAVAEADLRVVQAGPRPEAVAAAGAAVQLAQANADGARVAWQNAQAAVENPQELDAQIAQARTAVNLAEQAVELAEAELAREMLLRDQKPEGLERQIADLQVRAKEEARAAAEAGLNTAQTLLNRLWAIRSEPLALIAAATLAEGEYRLAAANVAVEQARLDDLRDGPTAEEVAVAEASVALARSQVAILQAQLDKFTITSPTGGVILEMVARPGEVVAPAATVLEIADLSEVTLAVYVPANRVGEVFVGQEVHVTVDGFPGDRFTGSVSFIGDQPEYTPRNVVTESERQNTFFAVKIRLPNPEGYLKPGMPADAEFQG